MARLTRWGNSNGGLRLPQAVLDAAGLCVGDDLACRLLDNGAILLTPRKGAVAIEGNQMVQVAPKKVPIREQALDKWQEFNQSRDHYIPRMVLRGTKRIR